MALRALASERVRRGLIVFVALAMVLVAGAALVPRAQGAFTGAGVVLDPGLYTGTNVYVPGETLTVTAYATAGDVLSFQFWNAATGVPSTTVPNQTVGSSGTKIVTFTIPTSWADGTTYQVRVTDTTTAEVRVRGFSIETYNFLVRTDRIGYLPGDTVVVSWSATYIKDGSPAPAGVGDLQVHTAGGVNLLSANNYTFSASQSSFSFVLATTLTLYQGAIVQAWFNDTAGLRLNYAQTSFTIGNLRISVATDQGTYAPGGIVTVTATARVQLLNIGPSPFDPYEPGVVVNVTVSDLTSGADQTQYDASGLTTDSHGLADHVFQLAQLPTTASYQVTASGTGNGVITVSDSTTFDVASTTSLSVVLTLDKGQYLSGDTIHATAAPIPAGTYAYTWTVRDVTAFPNTILAEGSGGYQYNYTIPATYAGTIRVSVYADDGAGHISPTVSVQVGVAYGYLSLSLSESQYNPGDTIVASFSLIHGTSVLTNPTYFVQVIDDQGVVKFVANTTANTASFAVPSPAASTSYTFVVTASQDGRTASSSVTAFELGGFILSVSFDKTSYMPGDTMVISYSLTARGHSSLPLQFHFVAYLFGAAQSTATTASPSGSITLRVPDGTSSGDLLIYVVETTTGAGVYETVHIGATNPLLTEVAGLPVFDWLLTLLVIVLLLVVLLLWRRTGMGRAPRAPREARGAVPPPPPSGPAPSQPAGPMSVTCKHCGKSIDITTSKRPIEVMCPSCGETQLVQ